MRPKWPRYRIKYSFFSPFLKHLGTGIGTFIPQPPLSLLARSDRVQGLVVQLSYRRVTFSKPVIIEWAGEWTTAEKMGLCSNDQTKGKQVDNSRGLRWCCTVFWVTEKWQSSRWSSWTRETLEEVNILLCCPHILQEVSQEWIKSLPFMAVSWRRAHIALIKSTDSRGGWNTVYR